MVLDLWQMVSAAQLAAVVRMEHGVLVSGVEQLLNLVGIELA